MTMTNSRADDLARARRASASAFLRQELPKGKAWDTKSYAYDYETEKPMYLGWFDDNVKKTTAEKVDEAIAAYVARFSAAPNIVLVNEADRIGVEIAGVTVRAEGYIRRNNFWVGFEYGYEAA